jgi:hypothetical protein
MALRRRLRVLFLCATLQIGVLAGVPMRPDEIEELMQQINQPKLAQVLPADENTTGAPPDDGRRGIGKKPGARSAPPSRRCPNPSPRSPD